MATFSYVRGLRGYRVVLTTANTKYSLHDLLVAADATVPTQAYELLIQSARANAAAIVYVGDVNLSTSNYGYSMAAGDSRTYQGREQKVDLRDFYLISDTNNAAVSVELVNF